ncbi:hypothetical protein E3O19_05840 [Cryobacterium algoritolerans]|uniref:Uncharacterized protein n=1 Tax=Cryobacterium algoritolerans TaxID=1259184 RepID=A0A4R8WUK3_9MICO|nr:hypothetical protein [Cryobacterium algoritolerans]TFC17642.1 hypothetical protein E3O19_05840 [Cryobacterium algoritolerans]
MNQVASSAVSAGPASAAHGPLRAVILVMLTLVAMLLCLVAVYSGGTGHAMAHMGATSMAAPRAATTNQMPGANPVADALPAIPPIAAAPATRTGPTMTLATSASQPAFCSKYNSLGGGGTAATSCSNVLVVGSNAILARMPSESGLVFASGGFVNDTFRAIPLHLHRPSLTLLSISRV